MKSLAAGRRSDAAKPAAAATRESRGRESGPNGCTIAHVSTGPQLVQPESAKERNWVPLVVAAAVVLAVGVGLVMMLERGKSAPKVTPISAALDPYAGNLEISNLHMSESANLAGGKSTFVDGSITNTGNMTVTAISVQVLFRDPAHEVAQNETQPLKVVSHARALYRCGAGVGIAAEAGRHRGLPAGLRHGGRGLDGVFPEIRVIQVEGKQGTVQ